MTMQCENCGHEVHQESELAHVYPDIPGILERLSPGERVPIGECPNCGALVHHSPDRLKCRICEEIVPEADLREHLRQHNPNTAGMDWEDVRNVFHAESEDACDEVTDEKEVPKRGEGELQRLECPNCAANGSMAQIDVIPGYAKICGVYADGTIEWAGETEIDWDNQRPACNPSEYVCLDCGEKFTQKQLGVKVK